LLVDGLQAVDRASMLGFLRRMSVAADCGGGFFLCEGPQI